MDYVLQRYKDNEIVLRSDRKFYARLEKITLSSDSYDGLVKKIDSYNESTLVIKNQKAFARFGYDLKRVMVLEILDAYNSDIVSVRITFNKGGKRITAMSNTAVLFQDCPENEKRIRTYRNLLKREKGLVVRRKKIELEQNALTEKVSGLFHAMKKVEVERVLPTISSRELAKGIIK